MPEYKQHQRHINSYGFCNRKVHFQNDELIKAKIYVYISGDAQGFFFTLQIKLFQPFQLL